MDRQLHGEGMNPPRDQSMEKAEFHLQEAGVVPWVEIPAELPPLSPVAAQNIQGGFSFLPAHFSFKPHNSLGSSGKSLRSWFGFCSPLAWLWAQRPFQVLFLKSIIWRQVLILGIQYNY